MDGCWLFAQLIYIPVWKYAQLGALPRRARLGLAGALDDASRRDAGLWSGKQTWQLLHAVVVIVVAGIANLFSAMW